MLQYLPFVALLACPVTMGVMMWMMRGRHGGEGLTEIRTAGTSTEEEIAILRAEIALLREEQTRRHTQDADQPRP